MNDINKSKVRDADHDDYLGDCEGCSRQLFIGDKGCSYNDGPITCESCSPTWEESAENWQHSKSEHPEDYAHFCDALAIHIAENKPITDKMTREL